ncbi:MAG: HNH endonuclease [Waterburya sp.]
MRRKNDNKKVNLKTWLVPKLRRASYMWPARKKVLDAARIERGRYRCAHCNLIFGPKEISLDHINPVVPTNGWDNWDGYITRLYCEPEGLQVLCDPCHDKKTKTEEKERKDNNV